MKRIQCHVIVRQGVLLPAFWIVFVVIWSVSAPSIAQQNGYFVQLRDKNESPYTISNPQTYLSTRAIERRRYREELAGR